MTQEPPTLPHADPDARVWRTYLRAGAFLIPSLLAWSFAVTFLLPKVQRIWEEAGSTASRAQWFMNYCATLMHSIPIALAGIALILFLAEFFWSAWPRYRRVVVACATLLFHTAVLVGITSIAIAACVAAPALARHKYKHPDVSTTPLPLAP